MSPAQLTFVDVETTGVSPTHDRIIEVGAIFVENGEIVSTFESLVNPRMPVSPLIQKITGIKNTALAKAPLFEDVVDQLAPFLNNGVFVAHNARFDYAFLKNEFKRSGRKFSSPQLCTLKLSRYLFPDQKKHGLDTLIDRFNLSSEVRHRALSDAYALREFYQLLQHSFTPTVLEEALKPLLRCPSFPPSLSPETIDSLPDTPGVYVIYGHDTTPLYVGKSVNVRQRVLAHFRADHTSPREMKIAQQVCDIDVIETPGELGALLREAQKVKELQPFYNRRLRMKREIILLKLRPNDDGYEEVVLETVSKLKAAELHEVWGVFTSRRSAQDYLVKQAKEHNLCDKLLGLDATSEGACWGRNLERCRGACVNEETPVAYNARLHEALSSRLIKKWPYQGPIAVVEQSEEQWEAHLIDRWCYVGTVQNEAEIHDALHDREISFDPDIYMIVHRFLKKKRYKYAKVVELYANQVPVYAEREVLKVR